MTSETDKQSPADPQCWCCGSQYPETDLVRLCQHPEAAVCLRAPTGCAGARPLVTTNNTTPWPGNYEVSSKPPGTMSSTAAGTNADTSSRSYDESIGTCHNHACHRQNGTPVSVGGWTDQNILATSHSSTA